MNYRTMAVAIIGIICITGIICFKMFVNWQTGTERCTVTTELQHDIMLRACEATIIETFNSMDKELCSTWNAEVELKKLDKQ